MGGRKKMKRELEKFLYLFNTVNIVFICLRLLWRKKNDEECTLNAIMPYPFRRQFHVSF